MKQLLLLLLVCSAGELNAQTWQSIDLNADLSVFPPFEGFKVNPYTNDLWFLNWNKVSCLKEDGSVNHMDMADVSGDSWSQDIAFTPAYAYFMDEVTGLYRINTDYSTTLVYNVNYVGNLSSNNDTIYMTLHSPDGYVAYTSNGSMQQSAIEFDRVEAKGNVKYAAYDYDGYFMKYTGVGFAGYEAYNLIDDEYICSQFHDAKFSRLTDTFFVSCELGISKAIHYDFGDSIVPSNTLNMPSANVIEFEFDAQDRIWAVFGDANDVPFAFARLDGNAWTNRYDASNCPVDFATYRGLEIDALGNLWISDNSKLHTLLTSNSPAWLGTAEKVQHTLKAYPNPAKDNVTLEFPNPAGVLQITTISGSVMSERQLMISESLSLDVSAWNNGCYIATWSDGERKLQVLIVK